MINLKKIIAVLLFAATMLCLHSQSAQPSRTISEDSIVLTDNTTITTSDSKSTEYKGYSTVGSILKMIFSLVIVIGLIAIIFWFIKRKTKSIQNNDDYLRRAAFINISPTKTIEVITLIDKAYLIGVTEDNITLLGEINDKELVEAMNINADKKINISKPKNFAQVLDSFLVKAKNTTNIFSSAESRVNDIISDSENSLNAQNNEE